MQSAVEKTKIYRSSVLGSTLQDAYETLEHEYPDELTSEVKERILIEFDRVVAQKFSADLKQEGKLRIEGKCSTYNYVDDVWKFDMSECEIKGEGLLE